jgi:hypothetical protein
MALFKSRIGSTLRIGFKVKFNGARLAGQVANLTAQVLSPTLGVSTGALTVVAAPALGGIYYVDVASTFFTTNGVGPYLLVVDWVKPAPMPASDVNDYPIEITTRDLDDLATPADITAAETSVLAAVAAVLADTDDIQTRLPAALVGGRMDASVQDIAAGQLAAIAAAVMAFAVETGYSADRVLRIIAAAVAGKSSGGKTDPVFRNLTDASDQITGAADDDGNRTAATYGP